MTRITDIEKRQRLINMRECLRLVQKRLSPSTTGPNRFICHIVDSLDRNICNSQTKTDTQIYVYKALNDAFTFETCMSILNPGRSFSNREIMTLRRKFIDILCNRISIEIAKF